jgi:DNA-binding response OmpR family regulator
MNTSSRSRPLAIVVEDDPGLRQMIMRALATIDVEAKGFGSGEEALAFIEMNPAPDLVHLDLVLPWMCGLRVCEALRYSAHTAHVPIMIVTGRTEMQDEAAALEAGADAFLEKPFKLREYLDEVRRLIGRPWVKPQPQPQPPQPQAQQHEHHAAAP